MIDLPPDVRDRAAIAAKVALEATLDQPEYEREAWGAAVDAVAEVLAAEHPVGKWREVTAEQPVEIDWKSAYESVVGAAARCQHVEAEWDALKARVAELSTEHLHLSNEVEALEEWNFWLSRTLRDMARRATSLRRLTDFAVTAPEPRGDRDALQARVDELTSILESKNADLRKLVSQLTQATVRAHNERARVDLLTTALTGLVDRCDQIDAEHQAKPFNDGETGQIDTAEVRAALSATPTGSEAP